MTTLFATMAANLEGTRADIDSEFLHDFRVAVRRTRSVLGHGRRGDPTGPAGRPAAPSSSGWATSPPPPVTWTSTCSTSTTSRRPSGRRVDGDLVPLRSFLVDRQRRAHARAGRRRSTRRATPGWSTSWSHWLADPRAAAGATDPAVVPQAARAGAGGGRRAHLEDLPAPGARRSAHHPRLAAHRPARPAQGRQEAALRPGVLRQPVRPRRDRPRGQGAQGGAGRARAPSRTARCRRRRWPGWGRS